MEVRQSSDVRSEPGPGWARAAVVFTWVTGFYVRDVPDHSKAIGIHQSQDFANGLCALCLYVLAVAVGRVSEIVEKHRAL